MPVYVGYEYLRQHLNTGAWPLARPAAVFPVTKVTPMADYLQVPPQVAPTSDMPLDHLLFALKHEGLELQSALLALKHMAPQPLAQAFAQSPGSSYLRQACYLWEVAHQRPLDDACVNLPAAQGGYQPLLDPGTFITGPTQRNARWRIDFNGLGTPRYCPSVRRTPTVQTLLAQNTLAATEALVHGMNATLLDRAMNWAYLSETESSYAIERESPPAGKAQAFAALLAHAHQANPLSEDHLTALQNLAVSNPLDRAAAFRHQQNWLRGPLHGAAGVTYVPPPPDLLLPIMDDIMALANRPIDPDTDPLVMGALLSFAFVFAHPFMDGNGRLSRFLFHRIVCASGRLNSGLVLPISVAMKRHENRYLQALQSFSKPMRDCWDVTWIDGDQFALDFQGPAELYRYWDATACVEFGLQMAQEALEHDLRSETDYLIRFDRAYTAVNQAIDMNGNDLVNLVRWALQNGGVISNNRRKALIAKGHPEAVIDAAQDAMDEVQRKA